MAILKYRIVSDSMTPLIPIGAEVLLEKINQDRPLKKFDIIVFEQKNFLTCHYVWHQNTTFDKGMIITRSLKYNEADTPFERDKIVGLVSNYQISFFIKMKILLNEIFHGG